MRYRWQTILLAGIMTGIFLTGSVTALAADSSEEGETEIYEEDTIQVEETESYEEDPVQTEETKDYEAVSASGRLKTGLEWTLKNGTLSFSAEGDGKWVIPDCKPDGSDIPWKKYLKSIQLIDFPMNSREVSIGSYAFKGCTALKEVWLDDENVDARIGLLMVENNCHDIDELIGKYEEVYFTYVCPCMRYAALGTKRRNPRSGG